MQVPFGALSDSTRAALAAGLESTGVEKQIENEGDAALYALLPQVYTLSSRVGEPLTLDTLGKLPHQHARCQHEQHDKLLVRAAL